MKIICETTRKIAKDILENRLGVEANDINIGKMAQCINEFECDFTKDQSLRNTHETKSHKLWL